MSFEQLNLFDEPEMKIEHVGEPCTQLNVLLAIKEIQALTGRKIVATHGCYRGKTTYQPESKYKTFFKFETGICYVDEFLQLWIINGNPKKRLYNKFGVLSNGVRLS
ncbi:hypothetical protein HCA99_00345 [Listeria booriae]|uniref:hypothetical protein n=1 Tax=Listeria booriae TaxID=1552123 RepID=UPI001628217E|nr:hypothetical protein [Listeria booriae]MBC2077656.1 hypothetical protein [Listeria booriae]